VSKAGSAVTIDDLRELARRRLPRMVFDFVDGGAEDELTLVTDTVPTSAAASAAARSPSW